MPKDSRQPHPTPHPHGVQLSCALYQVYQTLPRGIPYLALTVLHTPIPSADRWCLPQPSITALLSVPRHALPVPTAVPLLPLFRLPAVLLLPFPFQTPTRPFSLHSSLTSSRKPSAMTSATLIVPLLNLPQH